MRLFSLEATSSAQDFIFVCSLVWSGNRGKSSDMFYLKSRHVEFIVIVSCINLQSTRASMAPRIGLLQVHSRRAGMKVLAHAFNLLKVLKQNLRDPADLAQGNKITRKKLLPSDRDDGTTTHQPTLHVSSNGRPEFGCPINMECLCYSHIQTLIPKQGLQSTPATRAFDGLSSGNYHRNCLCLVVGMRHPLTV